MGISSQMHLASNIPSVGKAEIALLFAFVHHRLGLPEPRCSPKPGVS